MSNVWAIVFLGVVLSAADLWWPLCYPSTFHQSWRGWFWWSWGHYRWRAMWHGVNLGSLTVLLTLTPFYINLALTVEHDSSWLIACSHSCWMCLVHFVMILECHMVHHTQQPANLQQLGVALQAAWHLLTQQSNQSLINSMPWRVQAVLTARGGNPKYWYSGG